MTTVKTRTIGSKVTLEEYGIICQRAGKVNLTVSTYVKTVLLKEANPTLFAQGGNIGNIELSKALENANKLVKFNNDRVSEEMSKNLKLSDEITVLKKQLWSLNNIIGKIKTIYSTINHEKVAASIFEDFKKSFKINIIDQLPK